MNALIVALVLTAEPVSLLEQLPTIHVTGVGRAAAAPDKVDVYLTVQTEDSSVENAMKANATELSAVMAATRAQGISPTDVQLSAVNVSTRNDYEPSTNRVRATYFIVRKDLVLCLRSPPKLDSLLIDLAKAKALVNRIDFASDALKAQEDSLAVRAMENARKRAESMAVTVGARVGRALKVTTAHAPSRSMETYSTGGGVSVGEAATGALSSLTTVEVDFELLPANGK
ncbi:MAG: SIMPL domain-containing protein [Archangium sp.]